MILEVTIVTGLFFIWKFKFLEDCGKIVEIMNLHCFTTIEFFSAKKYVLECINYGTERRLATICQGFVSVTGIQNENGKKDSCQFY